MILITGATGTNGTEIIKRLACRGEQLRAMVRQRDGILGAAASSQPEFVQGNFDDAESLRKVLEGVQRAFLVTNSSERVEEQQLRFVAAAREAGVRHIVYLSQLHASIDSPVRFLRYHAVVEEAIAAAGMSFTHLRPNLSMHGLLKGSHTIAQEGQFFAPAGDARVSIVDARDVAAVAVAALTQKQHEGKTYDITGPAALTHQEMAGELSSALGHPVEFIDLPEDRFRKMLVGSGMPAWQADGLMENYAHYRRGEAAEVTSTVAEVTGQAAQTFRQFAEDHRSAFMQSQVEQPVA